MEQKRDSISRGVTSTNIAEVIGEMKNTLTKQQMPLRRFRLSATYDEFRELLALSAQHTLRQMGSRDKFIIDSNNEATIEQLYLYLSHNPKFEGDLNRGVMLQGKYGCGKTLLMRSYAHLQNHLINRFELHAPLVTFKSSTEIVAEVKASGVAPLSRRELMIDEFGREPKSVMDFGNTIRPMAELVSARAESGAITHATSNFTLERLSGDDFYGAMVGDRLRAMFNFIVLRGDSRRH
ncbi:MAG: hypothetical protein SNG27_06440 [Rikenellaceae bacterium]